MLQVIQKQKGYALEGEGGQVKFTPASSGEYTFTITASREGENDKAGNTVKFNFEYPLSAPSISSATSMGNGTVSLVWQSVKEATIIQCLCWWNKGWFNICYIL